MTCLRTFWGTDVCPWQSSNKNERVFSGFRASDHSAKSLPFSYFMEMGTNVPPSMKSLSSSDLTQKSQSDHLIDGR